MTDSAAKIKLVVSVLEAFKGEGDFLKWLQRVEVVCKGQGVKNVAALMPMLLTERAFDIFMEMPEAQMENLSAIKLALGKAFGVNCYEAYKMLKTITYKEGEPVETYVAEIKRWAALAKISDGQVIKLAFIDGLPTKVAELIKREDVKGTLALEELVALAALQLSTVGTSKSTALVHVGESSNKVLQSRHAWKKSGQSSWLKCFRCGEEGHMAKSCKSPFVCFHCKKEGHFAKACPEKGNEKGSE